MLKEIWMNEWMSHSLPHCYHLISPLPCLSSSNISFKHIPAAHHHDICYLFYFNVILKYSVSTWATAQPSAASFNPEIIAMARSNNNAYFIFKSDNVSRRQTHNYVLSKFCSLHPFLSDAFSFSGLQGHLPLMATILCQYMSVMVYESHEVW